MKKIHMIRFANKKNITQNDILEKILDDKRLNLKLLEKYRPITHAQLKEKAPIEFLELNVRVLNTLSRTKSECLQSQKKKTIKVSPNCIIKTILTEEGLDQNYILLIKRPIEKIEIA